jgi:Big-like domain-containing protein/cadherin-like protein
MRKRHSKWFLFLAVFFVLALCAPTAQAVLLDVGPTDLPSPPGNGFPFWYRDTNRLALAPCLSQTVLPSGPACVLLADPGFNPALAVVFPTNYPIETFYFVSDAILNVGAGGGFKIKYRAALEGSFGTGIVTPGGQVAFARIRIFADVPVAGTYTFTHPYGVETITATTAGTRAITFTRDIGIAVPFAGPLAGDIGPWLIMTGYPQIIGTETFIGDPNIANTVTGSPFGTNFFKVVGPAGSDLGGPGITTVQTNLFTVAGKTAAAGLGTPLTVDKATYTRGTGTAQVSVFATTQPISNAVIPGTLTLANTPSALQFSDASGVISATTMTTNNPIDGKFYGTVSFANPVTFPTSVSVTNTADVPVSTTTVPLVDEVAVAEASYSSAAKILKVTAVSGDKLALPALTVVMQDGATAIPLGTIAGGGGALQVTFPFAFSTPAGIKTYEIPPVRVTVRSALGGSDTEVVTGLAANTPPVARNDAATVATNGSVIINVAINDTDPDLGDSVVPSSVAIVASATTGTAFNNGNGTITYTAPAVGGTATFTYTINDTFGAVSNVATVTVTISSPPVANNDLATTQEDFATIINVVSNDTPTATIAPATVAIVIPPQHGTAVSLGNGAVSYTPALNYNGPDIFLYTVRDTAGILSTAATVTVDITPVPDAPLTVNDTAITQGNTPVTINVLANDTHPDQPYQPTIAINPATLTIATPPLVSAGTASVVAGPLAGQFQVLFTPATNFFGTTTFTYVVSDNAPTSLTSLPATVTVTVTPVNVPPVANNDAASTNVNLPRIINVLANDTDLNGNIAPGTVVIVSQPTPTGTATANLDGTVTFTSSVVSVATFTYNVKDTLGAVSNDATVSVNVLAATPTDSVTILKAQYTQSTGQWIVEGTTTGLAPTTQRIVTCYVGSTTTGQVIESNVLTALADGRWKFSLTFGANQLTPVPTNTISASLPSGASHLAFPVVVK